MEEKKAASKTMGMSKHTATASTFSGQKVSPSLFKIRLTS